MGKEKSFENKLKKYLTDRGCWYVKFFANLYTEEGIPDLLTCINGYFVAIEVKAKNGKPTIMQYEKRDNIRDTNGISIILYPDQFDEFKEFVERLFSIPNNVPSEWQYKFDKKNNTTK